jgi:hypothetical protein
MGIDVRQGRECEVAECPFLWSLWVIRVHFRRAPPLPP